MPHQLGAFVLTLSKKSRIISDRLMMALNQMIYIIVIPVLYILKTNIGKI